MWRIRIRFVVINEKVAVKCVVRITIKLKYTGCVTLSDKVTAKVIRA